MTRRSQIAVPGLILLHVLALSGAAIVNEGVEDGWQPLWEVSPEHPPRIP